MAGTNRLRKQPLVRRVRALQAAEKLIFLEGTGFTGCGKTRVFLRSEGYGLQLVHKGNKKNGLYRLRKNPSNF